MRGQSKHIECLELKQKAEKSGCKSRLAKTIVVPPTIGWGKPNMSLITDRLTVLCSCFMGCSLTLFLTPLDQTLMLTQIPKPL